MNRLRTRCVVLLTAFGAVMFASALWFNHVLVSPFYGDFLEWLGTALLVAGAALVVQAFSENAYVSGLFYGGGVSLIFARLCDFTDEIQALTFAPVFGGEGLGHTQVKYFSESFGYISLLLAFLVLLYELARLKNAAVEEHRRYREAHDASLLLALVADMSAEAVMGLDREGLVRTWNRGAEQLFGYTRPEVMGLRLDQLIADRSESAPGHLVEKVSSEGSVRDHEVVGIAKNGRRFPAETTLSAVTDEEGHVVGVSMVVRDVEERKRAERELVESRNLLAGALQSAEVGMFILGSDTHLIEFNGKMEELTGFSRRELDQMDLATASEELMGPHVHFAESLRDRVFERGESLEFRNLAVRREDGGKRVCNLAVSPIFDGDGKVMAAAGIAVDTTEREVLQARLLQSQKMESVGRLAGGIAHDFNNILSGILGYASLLRRKFEAGSPYARNFQFIEELAVRASELTHQLLAFARGGKHQAELVQLNDVVREALNLATLSLPPNIRLVFEPQEGLYTLEADPSQIHQVLMNLCFNARDAISGVGEIRVTTSNVAVDGPLRARLNLGRGGAHVRVTVADNGCGMPPEVVEKVFDPFFSTKGQGRGYGLGLSVVYGIVEAHRGALSVASEVGKGTCIDVYLPATGELGPVPGKVRRDEEEDRTGKESVLVVDDEQLIRALVTDVLGERGYTVLGAESGEEALEIYRKRGEEIALVILDLAMPGMGGAQAYEELARINPNLRCIISSGYGTSEIDSEPVSGKYVRFVAKPYQAHVLATSVRQLIDA